MFWYVIAIIISVPLSAFLVAKCYNTYIEAERKKMSQEKKIDIVVSCFICKVADDTLLGRDDKTCFHELCLQKVIKDPHDFPTLVLIKTLEVLKYLNDIVKIRRNSLEEISNKFNDFEFQKIFLGDKSASDFLKEMSYFDKRSITRKLSEIADQSPTQEGSSW